MLGLPFARKSSPTDPGNLAPAASRLAQEAALSALLGGNLFGRVAMHPLGGLNLAAEVALLGWIRC